MLSGDPALGRDDREGEEREGGRAVPVLGLQAVLRRHRHREEALDRGGRGAVGFCSCLRRIGILSRSLKFSLRYGEVVLFIYKKRL